MKPRHHQEITVPFDNNVAKRGDHFIVGCDLCGKRIRADLVEKDDRFALVGRCPGCGMVTRYLLQPEQLNDVLAMPGPLTVRISK